MRDDVLARLLALNAERYAEEVALGLHSRRSNRISKSSKPSSHEATSQAGAKGIQIGMAF